MTFISLAEELGVKRLELANTQFYGWGFRNRRALIPTRAQVERAGAIVRAARERLRGRMEITYVLADYYEEFPKPCMNGWGRQFLTIVPDGRVLPCPAAASITTLHFENVRDHPLSKIWNESRGFSRLPQASNGCQSHAARANGVRSISAVVAARRSC